MLNREFRVVKGLGTKNFLNYFYLRIRSYFLVYLINLLNNEYYFLSIVPNKHCFVGIINQG